MNNSGYQVIYWQPTGFALLKQQSGNFIIANHRNTSFPTLIRECGFFFGETTYPITVVLRGTTPILVPKELFTSTNDNCWRNLIALAENDTILADELEDYMVLYPAPAKKMEQLCQRGVPLKFQHNATILARYLARNYTDFPNRLVLSFAGNTADYVLFCGGKMVLINSLRFVNAEELVYYVANILQQQEIAPSECAVLFSGEPTDAKKLFEVANSYFPIMEWAGSYLPIKIENAAGRVVPAHEVLTLLPF